MKCIKLTANSFFEVGDMVRTKTGERCKLVDIGDTIYTSGSYISTDYEHRPINGTENFVIADCEVI